MISREMCRQGAYRLRRVATPLAGLALLGALFAGGTVPAFAAGGSAQPSPAVPGASAPVVVAPSSPKPARPQVRTGDVPKPSGGVRANVPANAETAPYTLTFSAYANPVLAGNTTYLTATTNQDVGPTPYWIQIYNASTGVRLVACGTGTSCTATDTSATPATRSYLAVVSYYAITQSALSGVQVSRTLNVTWAAPSVTLTASDTTVSTGTAVTLTANTSFDVGPTPYWTEIFDTNTGTRIAVCGGGTSCSATATYVSPATHRYVAYISSNDTTYPPAGILAVSVNQPWVTWRASTSTPVVVSLVVSGTSVTATANVNVGPTPYWIEIFSETRNPANGLDTGHQLLASCGFSSTCTATALPGTVVTAFISYYSSDLPPANTVANSNSLQVPFLP